MKQLNVPKQERGFTLIEIIVTVIVVGILSAVAAPSLLGLLNQTRVNDGLRQIQSSLKEAQRQAMRRGDTCTVTLDATNNTIIGTPVQCLAGSKTVDSNLKFKGDADPVVINFSRKGSNASGEKTIAIYRDGVTNSIQKCVILTANLGGVKTGIYTGSVAGTIVKSSCDVSD